MGVRLLLLVLSMGALLILPQAEGELAPRFARVAWGGDAYHLSFELPERTTTPPTVSWDAGREQATVTARHVPGPPDDEDAMYLAKLPPRALTYRLDQTEGVLDAPPTREARVRVAFLADMGRGSDAQAVWDAITRSDPDLVIIGGDISYAHGRPDAWDEWFRLVEPLASRVPVMVAFGNHESYCQGTSAAVTPCLRETQEYAEHFHMPNAPHRFYDFDWGPVRFLALDTEAYEPREGVPATDPTEQRDFAARSLNETDAPWRIAFFHRPLYSTTRSGEKESPEARADLSLILDAGRVDLVLTGHAHSYERSWPLREGRVAHASNETRQGDGWIHVTSGGGGRSLYREFGPSAEWSATRAAEFHFVLLDITPQRLHAQAIRPDGSVLDDFSIDRSRGDQLSPPITPTSFATPEQAAPSGGPSPIPRASPSPTIGIIILLAATLALIRRR